MTEKRMSSKSISEQVEFWKEFQAMFPGDSRFFHFCQSWIDKLELQQDRKRRGSECDL